MVSSPFDDFLSCKEQARKDKRNIYQKQYRLEQKEIKRLLKDLEEEFDGDEIIGHRD